MLEGVAVLRSAAKKGTIDNCWQWVLGVSLWKTAIKQKHGDFRCKFVFPTLPKWKKSPFFLPKNSTAGLLLLGFGALCLRRPGRQVPLRLPGWCFGNSPFNLTHLANLKQLGTGCVAVFFSHCLCLVEGCIPFPCAKPTFCLSFWDSPAKRAQVGVSGGT